MAENSTGYWVSDACRSELCPCGEPAYTKVKEMIWFDDPVRSREPLAAPLCRACFTAVMGLRRVEKIEQWRERAIRQQNLVEAAPQ